MVLVQQLTGSSNTDVRTGDKELVGIYVATGSAILSYSAVNSVSFKIFKVGSPTGTCAAIVADESGTTIATSGTLDVSTIDTDSSGTFYQFDFSSPPSVAAGYRIMFKFTGGDSSNRLRVKYSDTNQYDSSATAMGLKTSFSSGSYIDTPTYDNYDMIFKLDLAEGSDSEGRSYDSERLQILSTVVPR